MVVGIKPTVGFVFTKVFGKLNLLASPNLLEFMCQKEPLGQRSRVRRGDGRNSQPAWSLEHSTTKPSARDCTASSPSNSPRRPFLPPDIRLSRIRLPPNPFALSLPPYLPSQAILNDLI